MLNNTSIIIKDNYMNRYLSHALIMTLFFSFLSFSVSAKEKITVAFGNALAPWVIPETNEGIIIDIIEETMAPLGFEIEKVYLPYARRLKSYQQGFVDVVSDINPKTIEHEHLQGFFSDIAYTYENFAYSLKKNNYQFKAMMDLVNYRLMSWQGAVSHLGEEYAEMALNNPLYSEHYDQSLQVKMLYLERVDVIQMDQHIFNYYRSEVAKSGEIDTSPEVDKFGFFGESPNGFLFRNIKLRDKFNKQLEQLRASGKYQELLDRYGSKAAN